MTPRQMKLVHDLDRALARGEAPEHLERLGAYWRRAAFACFLAAVLMGAVTAALLIHGLLP